MLTIIISIVLCVLTLAAIFIITWLIERAKTRQEAIATYLEFMELFDSLELETTKGVLSFMESVRYLRYVTMYWEVMRHLETGHKKRAANKASVMYRLWLDWNQDNLN
jgi:hypothetical protein